MTAPLAIRCQPGDNHPPLSHGEIDLLDAIAVRAALDLRENDDHARLLRAIADEAHCRLLAYAPDDKTVRTLLAGLTREERNLVWSHARVVEQAAARLAELAKETR